MDFRNLCSRFDMDSIKAKFPPLPALPQIRLPKSLPKLKSRKIFRSSREDLRRTSTKQPKYPITTSSSTLTISTPIQPSEFINRTPTRISTISTLMQEQSSRRGLRRGAIDGIETQYNSNTYRSAHSIDDDDISFTQKISHKSFSSESLTENPTNRYDSSKTNDSTGSITKKTFSEKLQKGYKDISEFNFKNIISKKTVVRQDNIVVDYYAQRYNEDRYVEDRERDQRDREIADNYCFNFKETRQDSDKSLSNVSPYDSPIQQIRPSENKKKAAIDIKKEREKTSSNGSSMSDQSDVDESGMETTPPKRNATDQRSLKTVDAAATENFDDPEDYEYNPNEISSVWSIKRNNQRKSAESDESVNGRMRHKERMQRLTSSVSVDEEDTDPPESVLTDNERAVGQKFNSQQSLNEKLTDNKAMMAIKQNLKRFKSSISVKRKQPASGTETETQNNDANQSTDRAPTTTRRTTADRLAARLNRFKSREATIAENDNSSEKNKTNGNSPIKTALSNKLQTWKKSLKKRTEDLANATTESVNKKGCSPEKQTRSDTLIKKLKNVRNRKNPNSVEDLDADDGLEENGHTDVKATDGGSNRKSSNLEEKFENIRQRTFDKVNEKMQKMQVFYRSQENIEKRSRNDTDESNEPQNLSVNIHKTVPLKDEDDDQSSEESFEDVGKNGESEFRASQRIHAAWTTKPILTDSTESEDNDAEYPRVLIHQDDSDTYESTLIISVTTAAPSSSPRARITEILSESTAELPTGRKSNFNRDDETDTKPPKSSKDLLALPNTNNWIPNKDIISNFLEITPKPPRKTSIDSRGEGKTSKRKSSMDSNSDSDSWIPQHTKNSLPEIQKTSNSIPSQSKLQCTPDSEEPWKVLPTRPNKTFYKTQSIDIFAENVKRGGAQGAFEDFDDELKDEPVMKILGRNHCDDDSNNGSGEDHDMTDDDNASRITKVWVEDRSIDSITPQRSLSPNFIRRFSEDSQKQEHSGIRNSRESLEGNFDENDEYSADDDDDDYDDEVDFDRPPSTAPSPPPSFSPPPPPLPQRHPPRRFSKPIIIEPEADTPISLPPSSSSAILPPLPKAKPPPLPTVRSPPKVPKRNESMTRVAKPLVKTSSLRLTCVEHVKPSDVGKVNKLISRFEQPGGGDDSPLLPKKSRDLHEMRSSLLMRHSSKYQSDQSDHDVDEETTTTNDNDSVHALEIESAIKENERNCNNMDRKYKILTSPSKRPPPPPSSPPPPPPSQFNKTKQHSFNEENGELIKKSKKRLAPQPSLNSMPADPPNISIEVENTPKQLDRDNDNNMSDNFKLKHQVSHEILPQTNITVTTHQIYSERNSNTSKLTVSSDIYNKNIPLSQSNSEYGSPLEYPSSLIGSAETTPTPDRKQDYIATWRNPSRRGRSLVKDEDQYFSFDSDEENSYYSISSAGSNRYVIEI